VPDVSAAVAAYRALTGRTPDGLWRAPGRVNLIGDHTDYNDGLALPVSIHRSAVVVAGVRSDGVARCVSLQVPGEVSVDVDGIGPGMPPVWASPLLGVIWALRRRGLAIPGVDVVIDSDIPVGGGLASSAAIAVATALALTELTGQRLAADVVARCCQEGEAVIAGAPTGLMDQLAILEGRAGHAVFLDCRRLEGTLVAFRPEDLSASLLVIDTAVPHSNADAGYRTRREESAEAAAELGVASLRDATAAAVEERLRGVHRHRARHVVTENARVSRAVELLRGGRLREFGALLDESHMSLRDDYEVSCDELDLAVEAARAAGAWGARMTGAGFGGCAIALVPSAARVAMTEAVETAFARRRFRAPAVFEVTTADGASRCG
jgi:galactokinase